MDAFLLPYNGRGDISDEGVYILYDMYGGKFTVERARYEAFAQTWSRTTYPVRHGLVMDLAQAEVHTLVFDLDAKEYVHVNILKLRNVLRSIVPAACKNFTYLVCKRKGGKGMHVYLPEFQIAHDDYILLCQRIAGPMREGFCEDGDDGPQLELDIPRNFTLPLQSKPKCEPYEPKLIGYCDEKHHHFVHLQNADADDKRVELGKKFKRVKDNLKSVFRHYVSFQDKVAAHQLVLRSMMPVSVDAPYRLSYPTDIYTSPCESRERGMREDVAVFVKRRKQEAGYVSKGTELEVNSTKFLKSFNFLRFNTFSLSAFNTDNYALQKWHERFARDVVRDMDCPPVFEEINAELREENRRFADDTNPVRTILEYDDGYYFLPVFYALCNVLGIPSVVMVSHVRTMLDDKFSDLLDRIERLNESQTKTYMASLTRKTIHFCGNNLCQRFERFRDKLRRIVEDSSKSILACSTHRDLAELVRRLQENNFPIETFQVQGSVKKPSAYVWNCLREAWQEITVNKEKDSHIHNLWQAILDWLKERRGRKEYGGPDEQVLKKFNVNTVLEQIVSDSVFQMRNVQMDRHRWMLRTQDACVDLLTFHVGGTVPEFYLSSRRIGVQLDRRAMHGLLHESPHLVRLHEVLASRATFQAFLKACLTDRTDDLYATLRETLPPGLVDDACAFSVSMCHFYVDQCKVSAFHYEWMEYVRDLHSSLALGTNYDRKLFILKGETSNGKSMEFQLLRRVFHGYYHSVQADNFRPGHSGSGPTPELATTVFMLRVLSVEELEGQVDTARIKSITGNSECSFRGLYEGNQSDVPMAKMIAATNTNVVFNSLDAAMEARMVCIPFAAKFADDAHPRTSEQVMSNHYARIDNVVERSYLGCFAVTVYHLREHMDPEDGLLHYRRPPPVIADYTRLFLAATNPYERFKKMLDVQLCPGSATTMSELRSAVRQYLTSTKNNTTPESELILRFEREYSAHRCRDQQLGGGGGGGALGILGDVVEEAEEDFGGGGVVGGKRPSPWDRKNPKRGRGGEKGGGGESVVYYDGVLIRNLRRTENQ